MTYPKAPGFIYLACPYAHPDPKVQLRRVYNSIIASAHLADQGHSVYNPIGMTHWMANQVLLTWEQWMAFDRPFVEAAEGLMVLVLPGTSESKGVAQEIEWAKDRNIPVDWMLWREVEPPKGWPNNTPQEKETPSAPIPDYQEQGSNRMHGRWRTELGPERGDPEGGRDERRRPIGSLRASGDRRRHPEH